MCLGSLALRHCLRITMGEICLLANLWGFCYDWKSHSHESICYYPCLSVLMYLLVTINDTLCSSTSVILHFSYWKLLLETASFGPSVHPEVYAVTWSWVFGHELRDIISHSIGPLYWSVGHSIKHSITLPIKRRFCIAAPAKVPVLPHYCPCTPAPDLSLLHVKRNIKYAIVEEDV